jgi:hypothetical protein
MQVFSGEVMDIVIRPNSTIQERCLDLFFSKSPTSNAAGKAWLERIAARKTGPRTRIETPGRRGPARRSG